MELMCFKINFDCCFLKNVVCIIELMYYCVWEMVVENMVGKIFV